MSAAAKVCDCPKCEGVGCQFCEATGVVPLADGVARWFRYSCAKCNTILGAGFRYGPSQPIPPEFCRKKCPACNQDLTRIVFEPCSRGPEGA